MSTTIATPVPSATESVSFDLPPLRSGAAPAFVDGPSCTAWLDDVPLVNVGAANGMLYTQLEQFTTFACSAEKRFEALEVLRPAILTVQTEHAKRFRGKQLPLSPQRRENLAEVASLWDALARAYQRCLETSAARDTAGLKLLSKMCHRALDASVRKLRDYHHAYVQVPLDDYRMLHRMFLFAEREGVLRNRVRDPLFPEREALSCQRIYVSGLLFEAATPREHRPLALAAIERWIESWCGKVTTSATSPADPKVPPMMVDLAAAGGARRGDDVRASESLRFLDMSGVAHSLEKRIYALRHGGKPEELGLGTDLTKRDFETLLVALYRQWCSGKLRRANERQRIDTIAHVSVGIKAAHFFLSKRPFEQPVLNRAEASSDAGAPESRIKAATEYMMMVGITAEQWIVRDESVGGLGLIRPLDEAESTRLAHGQLVSVRPRGGNTLLVGTIQWLQEAQDGDLHVGVRLVPGLPSPVAVRTNGQEKFAPALMLAPVPALNAPSSLLLPPGTYAMDRVLQVYSRDLESVQLTGLLDAGTDFERVAFVPRGGGDGAA